MAKEPKTIIEKLKAIETIGCEIEVPYSVWSVTTGKAHSIRIITTNEISVFEDSDFCSLEQLRTALDWYANQLGGKITWKKL